MDGGVEGCMKQFKKKRDRASKLRMNKLLR